MILVKDLGTTNGIRYGIFKCTYCDNTKTIRTQSVLQGDSHCNCKLDKVEDIAPLKFISVNTNTTKIRWKVECTCGEQFYAVRSMLLNKTTTKCAKCARAASQGNNKLHVTYVRQLFLLRPDLEVLGTYINNRIPIRHRHTCGFEWDIAPDTLITNQNNGIKCHQCMTNGSFEVGRETILYYIYLPKHNLFKLGITKHSVDIRFRHEGCEIKIIDTWTFPCGKEAYTAEQHLLKQFKACMTNKPSPFKNTSNTELFDIDILEEIQCYMGSLTKS